MNNLNKNKQLNTKGKSGISQYRVLSKIYSREKTLFYFVMWNDADRMGYRDFLHYEVENNLFIIKPEGEKGSVWYSLNELEYIDQEIKKQLQEGNLFIEKIKNRLNEEWKFLLPYLSENKKIETWSDLDDYYRHLVLWWSAMNTAFTIPDMDFVDKSIREYILATRAESEKFTEQMNHLFVQFWQENFPEYRELTFFIQPTEAVEIIKGNRVEYHINNIKKRINGCYLFNGKLIVDRDILETELKRDGVECMDDDYYNTVLDSSVHGVVAFPSGATITGRVRVIMSFNNMQEFQEGDILVTEMTNPDYVPIMKIAKAVITDEGGVTCHASIVAREMKIPTLIGTKNATKILKDGDFVEVDADNGIVKILKKANES